MITEDIIIDIIKPHKNFKDSINQYEIAAEYMLNRDEYMTGRRVRRIIEELIKDGCPIISTPVDPGGYCWGGAENEALECYKRLRRKGLKILIRARRILRNSRRGQGVLFDINMVIKVNRKNKIKGKKRAEHLNYSHLTNGLSPSIWLFLFALFYLRW